VGLTLSGTEGLFGKLAWGGGEGRLLRSLTMRRLLRCHSLPTDRPLKVPSSIQMNPFFGDFCALIYRHFPKPVSHYNHYCHPTRVAEQSPSDVSFRPFPSCASDSSHRQSAAMRATALNLPRDSAYAGKSITARHCRHWVKPIEFGESVNRN
jgi:hypothetical protein